MYANYHTHTTRCGHASGSEREYVENAIKSGLKILGFSDHAPMPFPNGYQSGIRMKLHEIEGYVNTLASLREEYKDDIEIYIGYEAEYFPSIFDEFLDVISPYECDYIILGQHCIDTEVGGTYNAAPNGDPAVLRRYVDQVIEGINTGKFTYIAHPDLFNFTGDIEIYRGENMRLCRLAKEKNIPLEINFLGIMDNRNYPRSLFWDIAAECDAPVIFGCDAHSPDCIVKPDILRRAEQMAAEKKLRLVDTVKLVKPI